MNPSTVYCDNCGATNPPTASFCTKCGQAMAAAPSALSTQEARPSFPPGTTLYIWSRHSFSVKALAWSPDSQRIASGSGDKTVQVWQVVGGGDNVAANGQHILTYRGHASFGTKEIWVVAWSPDGRRIASASGDHTVQVWDASNGATLLTYRGHSDQVNALTWSPDGSRIASESDDKTVRVWVAE